jgi:hypothetical protein
VYGLRRHLGIGSEVHLETRDQGSNPLVIYIRFLKGAPSSKKEGGGFSILKFPKGAPPSKMADQKRAK